MKPIRSFLALLALTFSLVFSVGRPLEAQSINDILSEKNFKIGIARFYNREYEAAIQFFNKSLSYEPMNYRCRYYLGYAYLNAGYSKNALDEWENLVKLGGGDYQVRQKLNDLYFRMAIDKSYDYSAPYVFTRLYDGIENGMHKIVRPSFISYDEQTDSLFVSSVNTKYVVEINNNGHVVRQFGRTFGDFSSLKMPTGTALYGDRIFIADYSADAVHIFHRDGTHLSRFGTRGFASSNIAGPMGLAVSGDEYIFVVDNGNDRIQKFSLAGEWIQTIGQGVLNRPTDIVLNGNVLYVSDTFNKRVVSFDTFGNQLETFGEGVLQEPRGLAVKADRLYIADSQNGLFFIDLGKKGSDNLLGKFGLDTGKIKYPFDVCLDTKNILYETDYNTQNIGIFTPLQLQYANLGVQISQIWLSGYPNNAIHLRVWDKTGKPVFNIKEENIILSEETTTERIEIPIIRLGSTYEFRKNMYVKFIIDKSLPMQDYDPEIVDCLNSFLKKSSGKDWIDIQIVNDRLESSGKVDSSVLWPVNYFRKFRYSGGSPQSLDLSIHNSVRDLLNVNRNKAIVIFTSGEVGNDSFNDYDPDVLLTYARQNAVPVYIVNFTDKNRDIFKRIADETFGKYYSSRDIKEVLKLYTTIKNAPPLEYILSYEGINLKGLRDFWTKVHVRVKYKGLVGVDDAGYYVPEFFTQKNLFGTEENVIDTNR